MGGNNKKGSVLLCKSDGTQRCFVCVIINHYSSHTR